MDTSRWIRIALGYLALQNIQIGVWALVAPQSFYDGFPGLGRGWISVDGPFNEHLIRDVGALNLALAVLVVWAAVSLEPILIRVAVVVALVWGVPHLVYHLFNTEGLSTVDQIGVLGGLALYAAVPIGILTLVHKSNSTGSGSRAKASDVR